MSPEDFIEGILDYFEVDSILPEGSDAPNPEQILSVLEYIQGVVDFGYDVDTILPDAVEYLVKRNKEQSLISNQISNYADMGDESSIIRKF